MSWDQQFYDPIELPGRKPLVTLRDAAQFIIKLPKAERDTDEWQAVMQSLILVAEHIAETRKLPMGGRRLAALREAGRLRIAAENVDRSVSGVVDPAELAELVHEEADAGSGGTDHLSIRSATSPS